MREAGHVKYAGGAPQGLFVAPHVIELPDARALREEVFGPVLSIIPFEREEEAIAIGNATKYGLASGIWTTDLARALRVARAIHSGTVWINTYRAVAVQAPFGGMKVGVHKIA